MTDTQMILTKLNNRLRSELRTAGFKLGTITDPVVSYCEWQFTQINARPRELSFSRRAKYLRMPSNTNRQTLFDKIVKGEDVNGHLTHGLRDQGKHDNLCQAFGISHLHLRPSRSNELVLVAVDQNRCHVIDQIEHGQWWEAFKTSVEVMHDEWPNYYHIGLGDGRTFQRFASMPGVNLGTNTLEKAYQYTRAGIISPIPFSDGSVGSSYITPQGIALEIAFTAQYIKYTARGYAEAIDEHYPSDIPAFTMHPEQRFSIKTLNGYAEDYFVDRVIQITKQMLRR